MLGNWSWLFRQFFYETKEHYFARNPEKDIYVDLDGRTHVCMERYLTRPKVVKQLAQLRTLNKGLNGN